MSVYQMKPDEEDLGSEEEAEDMARYVLRQIQQTVLAQSGMSFYTYEVMFLKSLLNNSTCWLCMF